MIIKELFSNFAILISILFLYTQVTNNKPLTKDSSVNRKILLGLCGGLLSNVLMYYSIHFGATIIDLRHIPVILVALYGGAIPATISMVLVIIGRFLIGVNLSSYLAVLLIVPITLISIYLSGKNLTRKVKTFTILTFSNILFTILVIYLLRDFNILILLLPVYWAISYAAGFTAFNIVEFLRNSQEVFNKYKLESTTDALTGLNNFRKFDESFNDLIQNLDSKNEKLSLLYIDIDFFKKINDTYGHTEGDLVLRELGAILKKCTRTFDIVSRNGGEEFTALLLDCPLDRAVEISESIRKAVESHSFTLSSGQTIHITVSLGVATYKETTKAVASLIEDADQALYEAKRTGRNKVCVANYKE
jgi:diguanylate cyclase